MRGESVFVHHMDTHAASRWSANLFSVQFHFSLGNNLLMIYTYMVVLTINREYAIFHIKQFDSECISYKLYRFCCVLFTTTCMFM